MSVNAARRSACATTPLHQRLRVGILFDIRKSAWRIRSRRFHYNEAHGPESMERAVGRMDALSMRKFAGSGGRGSVTYLFSISPGGEIGRRKGLKILFPATGVWVQVPPWAPH